MFKREVVFLYANLISAFI